MKPLNEINTGNQVIEFPEVTIEGVGTNVMLVVPASALPRHVPSILMFLSEAARTIEQDGQMLKVTLRIIDNDGNIIKEGKTITIPRIEYNENDPKTLKYGLEEACRTSESKICYDVRGVETIVYDILEGAKTPPISGDDKTWSCLQFPQEIMDDSEFAEKDSYGLLTVLFTTSELKDVEPDKTPPGGILYIDLPEGHTEYPAQVRGLNLGSLGVKISNTLSAPPPCEQVQRLNKLLALVPNMNDGTKLLNDARRFIKDSLVFQMAASSKECTLEGAIEGVDGLLRGCEKNDNSWPSIRNGLALYLDPLADGVFPRVPEPEELIGEPAAYYEILSELSKSDRNAAIKSVDEALLWMREETYLAYHHYLIEMNVTVPEAFKAILGRASSIDLAMFFKPVFENFKELEPREKIKALTILREDMIRFATQDTQDNSVWKWDQIAEFAAGLFASLDGDTDSKYFLAKAIVDSLCAIDKDKFGLEGFKGPDKVTLKFFIELFSGPLADEYLKNEPQEAVRLFKWLAGLTSAGAIKMVNDDESLMLLLWNDLGQDDRESLVKVLARSVAEQILCVYLNMESFRYFKQEKKLGVGGVNSSFPNWGMMLGADGMAAVAVAVVNSEISKDALAVTGLPVIEAVMGGGSQEDRIHFVKRLMKESKEPHIVAALILNCFKDLDNKTWRWTGNERLQVVQLISNILDERASFVEDLPIIGPPADMEFIRYVRHVFRALADGDIEKLLARTFKQKNGSTMDFSFIRYIPMTVIPTVNEHKRIHSISLTYDNSPKSLVRVQYAFGLSILAEPRNLWNFWQDVPPTGKFYADAIKAFYRLAGGAGVDSSELDLLSSFISNRANKVFYDDALIGDFLEEKIIESLGQVNVDKKIAAWTINASTLIRLMPLERRLRVFKAVSESYGNAAKNASDGLSLGAISDVMGQAALGMSSIEELEIVLPIINLVGSKLNTDIPSDDEGFIGIITGMAGVIGMLDEDRQIEIIGKVFDECMTVLKGKTLNLLDRLFEPKDGETVHAGDFPRRVGRRLARSKSTAYAHVFLGDYANNETRPCEKRFDRAQEMALGAVEAYMDKTATITERDLQNVVFTISNNIIYEGSEKPEFVTDRTSSWLANLGEVGTSDLLFVGMRPLIQLVQSKNLPSWRKDIIDSRLKTVVPNFAKIINSVIQSDKLTPEDRIILAKKFIQIATVCVDEGWKDLKEQCEQIIQVE